MGINVGFEDPYSNCCLLPDPSDQIMPALLGGFASGRCRVDGMAIDCGWAMQMMESGSAVQCPNNNCGPRTLRAYDSNGNFVGRVLSQPFQAFADGYSGFLPPGARYQGNGHWGLPGTGSPARSGPPTLRPADRSRRRGSDDGTNEGRSYRLGVTPQRLFNHPQNPAQQNPGFSPEQIKAAVGHCTKVLFNVNMVDFQASSRGRNGFFNGSNLNISNPDIRETYIVNEVNAYTANQLARIHERIEGLRTGSVGRLAGLTIDFTDKNGNITGYSPYRNFTARDVRSDSSTLAGVSAVVDTQIWELGNSLGNITGKAIGGKGNEEGPAFEDCVRKQLR